MYQDGDVIHNMYFLTKGIIGFVLPRKGCTYIMIEPGDSFGIIDITDNIVKMLDDETKSNQYQTSFSKEMIE